MPDTAGVGDRANWPAAPPAEAGRVVVLHTRVVTETGGGPDKTILMSAPFLAHTKYWLAAAYMHKPEDPGFPAIARRAAALHSPIISVPDRGPLDRAVLREMLAICRHYNVRLWHGHDYKSNLLGLMLRPLWPMKLITTVHGWVKHTTRTPLYYAIDRWCLPYYHHVICVSDDLLEMVRKVGVSAENSTLVHNAIDEKAYARQYPPGQSPLRAKMKTPAGRLVVGAMGRLSPEKGFNLLVRSAGELVAQGVDLELWIAGEGESRVDLEKLIAGLGLSQRVKLLGFVADGVEFYHALDAFALSSLREGLPNVVLEAMAMGVPVVSTRVAGVPRLVLDGETGLLVPIGDHAALTAGLSRLLRDAQLRGNLVGAARTLIEREYSFTARMAKVKGIYDRVLGD